MEVIFLLVLGDGERRALDERWQFGFGARPWFEPAEQSEGPFQVFRLLGQLQGFSLFPEEFLVEVLDPGLLLQDGLLEGELGLLVLFLGLLEGPLQLVLQEA